MSSSSSNRRRAAEDGTKFMKLSEIGQNVNTGSRVHVYGVVIGFSRPKPTSGQASNKFCASYTLVDDTIDTPSQGIVLNMFGDSEAHFPDTQAAGNILLCFRCKVGQFRNNLQLTAYTQGCNWVVFYEKIDMKTGLYLPAPEGDAVVVPNNPIPKKSSMPQTLNIDDTWKLTISSTALLSSDQPEFSTAEFETKLIALHSWWQDFIFQHSLTDALTLQLQLSKLERIFEMHMDIIHGKMHPNNQTSEGVVDRADFVCLFLDLVEIPQAATNGSNAFIVVWDGTTGGAYGLPESASLKWNYVAAAINDMANNAVNAAKIVLEQVKEGDIRNSLVAATSKLQPFIPGSNLRPSNPASASSNSSSSSSSSSSRSSSSSSAASTSAAAASLPVIGRPCVIRLRKSAVEFMRQVQSGTWIRVRNCHIDPPEVDLLPLFALPGNNLPQCPLVGQVQMDSQIIPLPPYAR
jgi:hypothetical protein